MGTTEDVPSDREAEPGTDGRSPSREDGADAPLETPPGPDGLPLVGNTLALVRDPWSFYDRLATHGDVVSYRFAGMDFVTVLAPEHVERVLLTESDAYRKATFDQFAGRGFAEEGVLFSEGEQWRAQRTILQDAFTLDRIERYGETMVDVAAAWVDGLADGEELALNRAYSELTLAILAETLLDVDLEERGGVVTRVAEALNVRADPRSFSLLLPPWLPTPSQRRYDRALDDFEAMVDELVAERRGAADLAERDDLLSILLTAEGPDGYVHSVAELRDQLLTFLFAGHDTTSLTLTYASLLLAEHDDVLERLRAEWDEVLGDGPPDVTDLPRLEYTDRVLRETLRLYPPAYIVFREAARETELGGYRIPEGTKVTVPQFRLHADERFYDDPDRFRPDRWTDEFEARLPDYAYFPFGGGPRHCIGMRFARTELQLVLPTVLRSIDLELLSDPDPELASGATLQPADDVVARLRRRD